MNVNTGEYRVQFAMHVKVLVTSCGYICRPDIWIITERKRFAVVLELRQGQLILQAMLKQPIALCAAANRRCVFTSAVKCNVPESHQHRRVSYILCRRCSRSPRSPHKSGTVTQNATRGGKEDLTMAQELSAKNSITPTNPLASYLSVFFNNDVYIIVFRAHVDRTSSSPLANKLHNTIHLITPSFRYNTLHPFVSLRWSQRR